MQKGKFVTVCRSVLMFRFADYTKMCNGIFMRNYKIRRLVGFAQTHNV